MVSIKKTELIVPTLADVLEKLDPPKNSFFQRGKLRNLLDNHSPLPRKSQNLKPKPMICLHLL